MIDILFLSHNRLAFTKATIAALIQNTDWSLVRRLLWYDDASIDGTVEFYHDICKLIPVPTLFRPGVYGSPVTVMRDYLLSGDLPEIFAKIDNDTLVPLRWLTECLDVMDRHQELDLLGIEVFNPVAAEPKRRSYTADRHIGGIGFMRTSCFKDSLPVPNGPRYGFTEWQHARGIVIKGWLFPAIPVVLLDKLPFDPWASLSDQYIALGWQRAWPRYHKRRDADIWPTIEILRGMQTYG